MEVVFYMKVAWHSPYTIHSKVYGLW